MVGASGDDQESPDISSIIEEITDRADWNYLDSLVLFITGTGKRVAESYDGSPASAPYLDVFYEECFESPCDYAGDVTFDESGILPPGYATAQNEVILQGDATTTNGSYLYEGGESVSLLPDTEIGSNINEFEISINDCHSFEGGSCYIAQNSSNSDYLITSFFPVGQTFKACLDGFITSLDIVIEGYQSDTDLTLRLSNGNNTLNPLHTQTITHVTDGMMKIQLNQPFEVFAGETYAFSLQVIGFNTLTLRRSVSNPFGNGNLFFESGGLVTNETDSDLRFYVRMRY